MCIPVLAGLGSLIAGLGGATVSTGTAAAIGTAVAGGATAAAVGATKAVISKITSRHKDQQQPGQTLTVPPPIKAPTQADASVQKAGSEQRRAAAALGGYEIRTSEQGLGGVPNTQKKKLLGE